MGSRLESNSASVRKRIENHLFDGEDGDEYGASSFGGFTDYMRRKKLKLQNLDAEIRSQSNDNPDIFHGIVAHVNGYTQPSLNDLHHLIVSHGGGFLQYLDGKTAVTHVIASNLTPKKAVEFRKYRIVKPAWIVDSVKEGRLLPWNGYKVLDEGVNQKVLGFDKGRMVSQANAKSNGYREQSDKSWYTGQLKAGSSASTNLRSSELLSQGPPTPDEDGIVEEAPLSPQTNQASEKPPEESIPDEFFDVDGLETPPTTSPPPGAAASEPIELNDEFGTPKEHPNLAQSISLQRDACTSPRGQKRSISPAALSPSKRAKLTAEEHNAILLADPKMRKSTVVNPEFLEQYYRESRLHHLSTWKADLKAQFQAMAAERSTSQRAKQKRPTGSRRHILHVDFDSFFAAVSLKKHPAYKDKPAAVAHGNGSGSEIASCNYPARKYGIKNGMWMRRALEMYPELKVLPYDFPAYEEASRAFYEAIIATDGAIQSVSIDEALVDISLQCIAASGSDGKGMSEGSLYREQAKADEIAQSLRQDVLQRTGCNVSIGIGGNILLAKVALRKAKPAGQYQIKPEEVLNFIGDLEVQDLPGVAWSIGGKLEDIGVKFVKDIREISKERLTSTLGPKTGTKLWEYSRGIDRTEVGDQVVRKSVSAEVNWGVRFQNQEQADEFIESLCGELHRRLLKENVKGRQFTMKIMRRAPSAPLDPPKHLGHGKCDTYNKSVVLGFATNAKEHLIREGLTILRNFAFSPGELRGIGVQVTKLEPIKTGQVDSSQPLLKFKKQEKPQGISKPIDSSPKKSPFESSPSNLRRQFKLTDTVKPASKVQDDPIQDEPQTPTKPKDYGQINFGSSQLNERTPRKKPLNILGTQFVLPSQVDPKVLEELPKDIKAKLMESVRSGSLTVNQQAKVTGGLKRALPAAFTQIPNQSQLDPEALAAIPEDLREEILAHYQQPEVSRSREQSLLPQSPRKEQRVFQPSKKLPAPAVKRGRGRPPKSVSDALAAVASAKKSEMGTLTQANFTMAKSSDELRVAAEEIDEDILAALPDDIRAEILEEQRRERLSVQSLVAPERKKLKRPKDHQDVAQTLRTYKLPPRPKRPTFTAQKLHNPDELRNALKAWYKEFKHEGPFSDDVDALCHYLESVVNDEKDMDKAQQVGKWLEWVTEEDSSPTSSPAGARAWRDTVRKVKEAVQKAVQDRKLGKVKL